MEEQARIKNNPNILANSGKERKVNKTTVQIAPAYNYKPPQSTELRKTLKTSTSPAAAQWLFAPERSKEVLFPLAG